MCIEDKTGLSNLDQDWQLQGALNKRRYQDMELANTSNAAPEKSKRTKFQSMEYDHIIHVLFIFS
jgi:hypothetical protein